MSERGHIALAVLVVSGLVGGCVGDRNTGTTANPCGAGCQTGFTCVAAQCISDTPEPGLMYAAEVFAPNTRANILARTEIPSLAVEGGNSQVDVKISTSVEYKGRVLLHAGDEKSAGARVVFHRPSRIAGAPDYEVSANAMPGTLAGQAAFTVLLPTPPSGGETYDISIFPDDGTLFSVPEGTPTPSTLAPPVTLTAQLIQGEQAAPVDLACDSAGLRALTGIVVDAVSHPLAGMVVRAYVVEAATPGKRTLVSSTGITDALGAFQIFIPITRTSTFDLDVVPQGTIVAPTLTRTHPLITNATNLDPGTALQLAAIVYPLYPSPVEFQLPVSYQQAAGGTTPATGARILFTTTIASKVLSDTVRYDTEAVVDAKDGLAHAQLLPGDTVNRSYTISILPPQGAKNQSLWDHTVVVGATAGVLAGITLPERVQVSGRVLDAENHVAENVTVRPRISPEQYTAKELERLGALNLDDAATMANGSFTMYLDAKVLDQTALYDFDLVPPGVSALPQWSFDDLAIDSPTNATAIMLADFQLPAAAVASGNVTDQQDNAVATAEVHIYTKSAADSTWKLRTIAHADDSGHITLVLPSTP